MEFTSAVKSSQNSVVSPDSYHIATLTGPRLAIRAVRSFDVIRSTNLPSEPNPKSACIRWSPIARSGDISTRVLVADDDNARVWDLEDQRWSAVINNGTAGMGKIVNSEFGRSKDEVLLFSEFGSKVTAWSLVTGRTVEIRDPKFSNKGFGFRPKTGLFALLSRPGPQDILTLHAPGTYFVLKTITLPSADAQGFKWSPDGRWIVLWDAPSTGYKIYVYTADGHLYRMYSGEVIEELHGLGVKSVEWSPTGEYLAVGGFDRRVTLLSTRTFSPTVYLDHTPTIQLRDFSASSVWQEQVSASSRTYAVISQPISPPTASSTPSDPSPKHGISLATFNADGTLIATRDDSTPTTVWIWDLKTLSPRSILIQHSPVKSLTWHPTRLELLLIQCVQDDPVVYLWSSSPSPSSQPVENDQKNSYQQEAPSIIHTPVSTSTSTPTKLSATFLQTPPHQNPIILLNTSSTLPFYSATTSQLSTAPTSTPATSSFILLYPYGKDPILRFPSHSNPGTPSHQNDYADESEDSLFEILTGRKRAGEKVAADEVDGGADSTTRRLELESEIDDEGEADYGGFEDTFRGRRGRGSGGGGMVA
ncbi:WD40 repeat-like protein [Aulographum hederae CBS 113979]|uniref:WD40 repeat-like protein n=1 Tax=Aulographum hederae CBS 113979 TaxID=1176131 RepID=A0A6G1H050_9PEZI|nr:WD40 repeat-like protein [Aulographum hederae CBS 113979]